MKIIVSQNIDGHQPPQNKREQMWLKQHQKELKLAQKNGACPSCGAKLSENSVLFDHGYKYGFECEKCV
ncbi:hypothetical protein Z957_12315 [Clostridium sp. K25]|uniref:Uncharacterized protein n=1 Tax=Clostridium novyi B str. ATCC 27606 TaxID=1443123 RepID=A0AA40M6L4_CLONO|nr:MULTISPECIES: hypothetical protein [Clostridium]KEI10825.1 hypothetical protein Z957_12315 [Clostridium sp. K25]KEI17786.1 hypothetical protein Z959_05950 [Clostridium novyi B str. ATCC 27606]